MVEKCIFKDENVYYLSLMSEGIEKRDDDAEYDKFDRMLIKLFDEKEDVSHSKNLSHILHCFLKLCDNGGVRLSKSTIEQALAQCKNEKCQQILKQYIEKENLD